MGKLLNGLIRKSLVGVGAAVLLSVSMGVSAQIASSKHNLTSTGTLAGNRVTTAGAEICVFCHTPHGSDSAAPLWNKTLGAGSFTNYASSTMDGSVSTGGTSLACLSCHDGSQAMDTMINAPGSGLAPVSALSSGAGRGYDLATWSLNADGKMAAGVANLTTDLTNDHPIQIPYCGGGMTASGATITVTACADKDFKAPMGSGVSGSSQKVWFDSGAATGSTGAKDKTDIQLYNRGAAGTEFFVECGSCHDPHNTANGTFLRISNAASAVCLTCHNK